MPLRDHFRPPISKRSSWEGFHGMWPGVIVQQLARSLPEQFIAEPRVHLGDYYEIDVCAFEPETDNEPLESQTAERGDSGIAVAAWTAPAPSLTVEMEFPEQYAYEVLIFDADR